MNSEHQIYLAPLQGLTDFRFRNTYQKYFGEVDKYFSPWIKLDGAGKIKKSQNRDVSMENNTNVGLIPQIMCNKAEDFITLAKNLNDLGYNEINWNLGCPHPMITKRGMGSALLSQPQKIISILENAIPKIEVKVSLKIRLGFEQADESLQLRPLLDNIPLTEIIIHARTAKQMYRGDVNLESFEKCLKISRHEITYNGDLNSYTQFQTLKKQFPTIKKWMIGRGLIANPFLAGMIRCNSDQLPENYLEIFEEFHQCLLESYAEHLSGEKHLLLKMLGFWLYFSLSFSESHKALKRIKKAKTLAAYQEAVKTNLKIGFKEDLKILDTRR